MRQRTEDVGYVEKQIARFESEDCIAKDDIPSSPNIPPFLRSFSTSAAADISTYNNAAMDVLDIKTMLLKVKRLLEQVGFLQFSTWKKTRSFLVDDFPYFYTMDTINIFHLYTNTLCLLYCLTLWLF